MALAGHWASSKDDNTYMIKRSNQIPKLEHEVMEALHCGVDVTIATAEPIETFPRLKALLTY